MKQIEKNVKKYKCNICGKQFSIKHELDDEASPACDKCFAKVLKVKTAKEYYKLTKEEMKQVEKKDEAYWCGYHNGRLDTLKEMEELPSIYIGDHPIGIKGGQYIRVDDINKLKKK